MRVVVQRVCDAKVLINDKIISEIERGLLIFLGINVSDTQKDVDYIINKILSLRIFNDENDIMNHSIADIGGSILVVSQFTLYGDSRKGNRPSYSEAMPTDKASQFFNEIISNFKKKYNRVYTGIFGADMKVVLTNDGPVTILIDSFKKF